MTKPNEDNGRNVPDYGMKEAENRALATLEKLLRKHDAALLGSMLKLEPAMQREFVEITDEGVAKFETASQHVAPFQKFVVGIGYTVKALQEWRNKGPLGD
jgi:hypothetical protein